MPDCFIGPFDEPRSQRPATPPVSDHLHDGGDADASAQSNHPRSGFEAALRGALNRCPSCGQTALFARYLKPADRCSMCSQDWTPQQADDFPAYLSILVTGHLLAPVIIALVNHVDVPTWLLMALVLTLAAGTMIALLQPAKGAIIAMQWWLGMHGFAQPEPFQDAGDSATKSEQRHTVEERRAS